MYPTDCMITDFAACLKYFEDRESPKIELYKSYLSTVDMRKGFSSASDAIQCDKFVASLHDTLSVFFRLARAGVLAAAELKAELAKHAEPIAEFDGIKLREASDETENKLWDLIRKLRLTKRKPRLVSGMKTLHLLHPDLVVPVDRQYTGGFLYRYENEFEAGSEEEKTFRVTFATFRKIAKAVSLEQYVGTHTLHASMSKVIDNALMGFVDRAREQLNP
jgi:hypothetical protein